MKQHSRKYLITRSVVRAVFYGTVFFGAAYLFAAVMVVNASQ